MGLCLTVRDKDIVKIGDVFISLEKDGSTWRILIDAPKEVPIERVTKKDDVYKQRKKNETN